MLGEKDLTAGSRNGHGTTRRLRVDLLTPCFWPEVRRGTERFTRELADGLIARGHAPRLITSHPSSRPARDVEDGLEIIRLPRPLDGRFRRRLWEPYVTHVPLAYAVLRAGDADVAHAMNPPDAAAAARFKEKTGKPAIFSFMGVPDHDGLYLFRKRLDFVTDAIKGCDAVVALSEAAAEGFRYWLGYDPPVIPPGVNLETFRLGAGRSPEPTVICSADMTEARKNVGRLIEAFRLVRKERPDAKLVLNKPRDARAVQRMVGDEPGVVVEDLDTREALAAAYGRAWVSALVSWSEAFGLVLAEALACGTPVLGSNHGGIPEVLGGREDVGRLVHHEDVPWIARGILECFELAEDPQTPARCRERAEQMSTEVTTERYLELYRELGA